MLTSLETWMGSRLRGNDFLKKLINIFKALPKSVQFNRNVIVIVRCTLTGLPLWMPGLNLA